MNWSTQSFGLQWDALLNPAHLFCSVILLIRDTAKAYPMFSQHLAGSAGAGEAVQGIVKD